MKEFLLFFLTILVIFSLMNKIKRNNEIIEMISTIDNRKYIVRKLPDSRSAADKLANINIKILKLINYIKDKDKDGIDRLVKGYNPNALSETGINAKYTSYSVNKGEKISICIRNKENNMFMNDNIIMFVVIHELAHIMTIQIGHPKEFWDNMKYLLEQAEEINLYNPEDYEKNPQIYCGMEINSSPYDFKKK
jgi:predicted metal-dependent hydrolase